MRILNRSENQNDNQKIYELQKTLEHTYRKLHKSKQNDNFMKKCLWHRVTPKNCKIPDRLKKYQSKEETRKNERREIEKKIQINQNEVTILENKFENILLTFRAHTILTGLDLEKCYTSDTRAHKLLHFLKQNPQLTLLNVDKSPSVCFIERKSYHEKLNKVFGDDQNF